MLIVGLPAGLVQLLCKMGVVSGFISVVPTTPGAMTDVGRASLGAGAHGAASGVRLIRSSRVLRQLQLRRWLKVRQEF